MSKRRNVVLVPVLVAVFCLCQPAAAQSGVSQMRALPKGAKAKGPTLTRDQLRQCVAQQDRLDADAAEMIGRDARSAADRGRIDALEAALKRLNDEVDGTSKAQVDAYNTMVKQSKTWVDAFNAELVEHRAFQDAYRERLRGFNADCAGHWYYDKDMAAVKAGK